MSRSRVVAATVFVLVVMPWAPSFGTEPEDPGDQTPPESERPAEEARASLDWYGYVKVDASWDDGLIDPGNFARWVESPSSFPEHGHFNLTARQSRLGLEVEAPPAERYRLTGRVEMDFYGGGTESNNQLQLRHAYLELVWLESRWELLAGHTWDLHAPLNPSQLNYTVGWWAGNLGFRRPQVRLTRRFGAEGGSEGLLALAVARTIGDDFVALEPGDSGSEAAVPTLEARAAWGRPWGEGRRLDLGLSAHRGEEDLGDQLADPELEFETWSAVLDVKLQLPRGVRIQGEAWVGQNVDAYFGGVGQGINLARGVGIGARGGWIGVDLPLARPGGEPTRLSFGVGRDDPDDLDLVRGSRSKNEMAWINAVRELLPDFEAGVELSYWETEYLGLDSGDSLRVQTSLTWSF